MAFPFDFQPDPAMRAQALERLMRQRQLGYLGQLSGDKVLSPIGQRLVGESAQGMEADAQGQQAMAARAMQAQQFQRQQAGDAARLQMEQQKLGLERMKMNQDQFAAIADPVTGGVLLYNKKTGQTRPLGPGGGTPTAEPGPNGKPPPLLPGKPSEAQRKNVALKSESLSQIDLALKALEAAPGAYGGAGNFAAAVAEKAGGEIAQSALGRRYTTQEQSAKNLVSNVVSKIINERAGASLTLQEVLRQSFLPKDTDSLEQARQKLADLRSLEASSYEAQSGGALTAPPAPPGTSNAGPVKVQSKAQRDALPAGTKYIGPDGKTYTKG